MVIPVPDSIHFASMTSCLPVMLAQMVQEASGGGEAWDSPVHIWGREPWTGQPTGASTVDAVMDRTCQWACATTFINHLIHNLVTAFR